MPSTPIARTKTAFLTRIVDSIPRGYTRYTQGTIAMDSLEKLMRKLHRLHAIGASPAQRITRKRHGRASALLAAYAPAGALDAEWVLLFTDGQLDAHEKLANVDAKPRLSCIGYELSRHTYDGRPRWTWRRPKEAMSDLYGLLGEQLANRRWEQVEGTLARIAHQPGFHGVREQSWRLLQQAKASGYPDELPTLYFVQKGSHGDKLSLD